MKTLDKKEFKLVKIEVFPEVLEEGKFYYSEKYQIATHLCPCGCGSEWPIPIKDGEWKIINQDKLTVTPSLHHRFNCKTHYIFNNGFANIVNRPLHKENWNVQCGYDTQPGE